MLSLRHQGDNQVEALAQQGFPFNPIDFAVTGALGRGDEAPCCWPAAGEALLSTEAAQGPSKSSIPSLPSLPSQRVTRETELASHPPPLLWPLQGWQTVPGAFWQH